MKGSVSGFCMTLVWVAHCVAGSVPSEWPALPDQELLSWQLPRSLLCQSCKAIAFQMHRIFARKARLRSSMDVIDAVEAVCRPSTFSDYSIVYHAEAFDTMIGPGLDTSPQRASQPTLAFKSARLSHRLADLCLSYLNMPDHYVLPEQQVYDHWLWFGGLRGLVYFLCTDPVDPLRRSCLEAA